MLTCPTHVEGLHARKATTFSSNIPGHRAKFDGRRCNHPPVHRRRRRRVQRMQQQCSTIRSGCPATSGGGPFQLAFLGHRFRGNQQLLLSGTFRTHITTFLSAGMVLVRKEWLWFGAGACVI